jgi:hypothetical protein
MSKNYFGGKPSSWKDNFENMRQQSEKIRKIAGMDDIEVSLSQEGRDYIEMLGDVVKITPEDYKDAMRLSALKHGRMRAEEDNRTRIRSSSKVHKLNFNVKHNPASTASRIATILKELPEGLHITRIMEELANRAQLSASVNHRYSHISKVLNSNYLLFEKIGPATFKSRSVLPWLKDDAPKQAKAKPKATTSPSFKDLILWAAKKWAKRLGNSPRNITDALNLAGIDVAYDTVKKVLLANKGTL